MSEFEEELSWALCGRGTVDRRECLFVGDTPSSLVMLGMRQLPMLVTQRHVRSIIADKGTMGGHGHGIGLGQLARLPTLLASPAMVMDSLEGSSRRDVVLLVLAETDADGLPLVCAVRPDGRSVHLGVEVDSNHVLSLYGKRNAEGLVQRAREQGKILFVDEEMTRGLEVQSQLQLLRGIGGLPRNRLLHGSEVLAHEADRMSQEARFRPVDLDAPDRCRGACAPRSCDGRLAR